MLIITSIQANTDFQAESKFSRWLDEKAILVVGQVYGCCKGRPSKPGYGCPFIEQTAKLGLCPKGSVLAPWTAFLDFSSPWTAIFYDLPSQIWHSQISDHSLSHQIWHLHRGSGDLWFPISTGLRVLFHFQWQSYPRKSWEWVHKKGSGLFMDFKV